jgi:hypothetical protein
MTDKDEDEDDDERANDKSADEDEDNNEDASITSTNERKTPKDASTTSTNERKTPKDASITSTNERKTPAMETPCISIFLLNPLTVYFLSGFALELFVFSCDQDHKALDKRSIKTAYESNIQMNRCMGIFKKHCVDLFEKYQRNMREIQYRTPVHHISYTVSC